MDTAFQLGNLAALLLWAALLASLFRPGARPAVWRTAGLFAPAGFALAYIALLAAAWPLEGGFGSPDAVAALFSDPAVLTAGWFHYLAFDLFVGAWIAREGVAAGVAAPLLVPCLLLTFLAGPAGFLLFLLLRALAVRSARLSGALS